jgi:hypothetical protein
MGTFNVHLTGGLGLGLDDIKINHLEPIEIKVTQLAPIVLTANTTSKVDLGLDNIGVTLGVRPTRVHFPINYHMCFSLFGKEIMKLGMCGESMVITECYEAHHTESCR